MIGTGLRKPLLSVGSKLPMSRDLTPLFPKDIMDYLLSLYMNNITKLISPSNLIRKNMERKKNWDVSKLGSIFKSKCNIVLNGYQKGITGDFQNMTLSAD